MYVLLLQHTDTCISRVDTLLKELKKNSNGSYSSENPLKVTVLGDRGNFHVDSLLSRELASGIAKHNLVKVTYLVPENSCSEREKRSAALNGVTIVEAKKQPGFDDPTDWLYFPPQDLKTDIVLGLGKVFGKIAQVFKALHRCKNIYIACTPLEEYQVLLEKKRISEEALIEHHRNFDKNFELCQTADLVVAPGPKMHEKLSAPLRYDKKDVFKLTPGILSKFSDVKHATDEQANFRMLMFGSGDPDAFEQEGLNTALAAVTKLKNKSYHLLYVCAAEGKREQIANHICKFGVSKHQVIIRSSPESEEDLKRLLCEADLAIMPSSKQGFGMMALAALSSGLPVLVHEDSGFGKALKEVPFGTLSTLESEDANDWAEAIKRIRRKERKIRLEEAASLRSHYDAKYSWEEQCRDLLEKMLTMVTGMDFFYLFRS